MRLKQVPFTIPARVPSLLAPLAKYCLPALLSVLFVGPLTCPLKAQTYEQKLDTVKEFKRFFNKFKELQQKVAAVFILEDADCPEAVETLIKVLRHREEDIRSAAKEVISGFKEPGTFEAMTKRLEKMRDPQLRASFFDILSLAKQSQLKPVMRLIYGKGGKTLATIEKYEMARAFGRLGAKDHDDILLTFSRDKAYEVQVAALDAIKLQKLKFLGKKIVPLLQAPVWQVRASAIHCVAVLRPAEAVEPLIEMLETEGRLRIDANEALMDITGRNLGPEYKRAKKAWAALRKISDFRLPTDAEIKKGKETREKYNVIYGKGKNHNTFAGIPTTSTRMIFIIDVSASMNDLVVDREKFRAGGYKSFQKLEIVKTELLRTINSLDRNKYFNIVAFATKVKTWKKWLSPGHVVNKASAISFVKRLKPLGLGSGGLLGGGAGDKSGKTNSYRSLMTSFSYDPAKDTVVTGNSKKKGLKLDTIYFLSDGRPSIGKYVDIDDILKAVRKINQVRKVVIHCISIGDFEATFLKRLARENGGVFVDLGG